MEYGNGGAKTEWIQVAHGDANWVTLNIMKGEVNFACPTDFFWEAGKSTSTGGKKSSSHIAESKKSTIKKC